MSPQIGLGCEPAASLPTPPVAPLSASTASPLAASLAAPLAASPAAPLAVSPAALPAASPATLLAVSPTTPLAVSPVAPVPAPFITVSHLRKDYPGGRTVIDDLSFAAAPGEFISVLGESGCGKSTLLKMIAGLSPASGGSIRIDGREPVQARALMSFVFQEPTLLPWRTVARNVELALEFEGGPRSERARKVQSVLQRVALSEVAGLHPRQLSGGMKMRVSIARALVTTPRLLLMDEPFGALDALTRQRLNEELLALKEQQRWTTLFVTHSVTEAAFLSDRILLMGANPGRVQQEIAVSLPAPRTAALRSTPEFLNLVGQVSRALAALHA